MKGHVETGSRARTGKDGRRGTGEQETQGSRPRRKIVREKERKRSLLAYTAFSPSSSPKNEVQQNTSYQQSALALRVSAAKERERKMTVWDEKESRRAEMIEREDCGKLSFGQSFLPMAVTQ